MQSKTTLIGSARLPRFFCLILFLFSLGSIAHAQTYVNGNLSTGATTMSGVAAPAGTTWSEVQNDAGVTTLSNSVSGVASSIAANVTVADDFTVPAGVSWNISKLTFYAYQTGAPSTPSPFNDLRVQIHNSDPSAGPTTIVFGDLTTNRLSATNDALMYRVFNTTTPAPGTAPGTTRKIWTLEANITLNLTPGTYWIEWQTGVTTGTHFSPPSTVVGVRTVAGYNAQQRDVASNTWVALEDDGNPATPPSPVALDMPFKIDYTAACAGTPAPGNTLSTAASACVGSPFTLSVANPVSGGGISYQWQSSSALGGPYTNIAGATSVTYVATQTASTYYQLVITCSGSPGTSTPIQVLSTPLPTVTAPANATVCSGVNNTFTVSTVGSGITYQWQESTDGGTTFTNISDGGIYSGATTASLTLTNIPAGYNGYQYHVIVTQSGCSAVTSGNATLTVNGSAVFTTQPIDVTVCAGSDATFTSVTSGAGVTYQWQVSVDGGVTFTDIPTATNATLVVPAVTAAMNGFIYHVIISNSCTAALTSNNAILTVSNVASITTQPAPVTVCEGLNASFTVTASATSYQWQMSTDGGATWTDIAGQTTTTLNLTAVTAAMSGNQYRLVAFSCGPTGLNSNAATLTVNTGVTITTQPANTTACVGADANFSVIASGSGTITYQWQLSTDGGTTFTNITGATAQTLTLTGVTLAMDNDLVHVILSNGCSASVISGSALLTVTGTASITTQPADASACEGSDATFTVAATGPGLSYQWQVSTDGGATFSNITGQTSATLTLTGVSSSLDNNQYQAVVTSSCSATGTASDAATLTVNALPVVVISAAPYTSLTAQLSTTLTAISTPAATSYSWFKDNVLISSAIGSTINVTHDALGVYTASVTDANGCSNTSNAITIADSTTSRSFIYPNPSSGIFSVVYYGRPGVSNSRNIAAYDNKGSRVYAKKFVVGTPEEKMIVDLSALPRGVYLIELTDASGVRLQTDKVVIN